MEWLKKNDAYFLWGSNAEEGLMMKFEFHGGLEAEANLFDIKNPLLGFSDGFNSDNWKEVKDMLLKVFGPKDSEKARCQHDYLLAFTRTGEILHLRVFKILQIPPIPSKQESIKLQCASPVFILKPLEIYRRDVAGGSEGYARASTFFDESRFMSPESGNCFSLDEHTVYSGSSSELMVSHVLHNYNSLVVLLPFSPNLSWIGFNTSCKEFFDRYHTVIKVPVPGKGPPSKLDTNVVFSYPMRVFMRSLIMEVGEAFSRECCFSDFSVENIFLRRGKAAILGVKQIPYDEDQARRNWKVIFGILTTKAPIMPDEVLSVYRTLAIVCSTSAKDKLDPRSIYPLLVNSFGWMDALDRHHMISDLYDEFLTFLDPYAQLTVARGLPNRAEWEKRFDSNRLLYCVRINNLETNCIYDAAAYKAWKEGKAKALNTNLNWKMSDAEAVELFNGRLYFGNMRHSYTHLPEHGLKAQTPLKLCPKQVDVVVSSTLGGLGATVQEKVPNGFPSDDPRSSHARFSRYFRCINEVEFNSEDEKGK